MSYTPPAGNAADFHADGNVYYPLPFSFGQLTWVAATPPLAAVGAATAIADTKFGRPVHKSIDPDFNLVWALLHFDDETQMSRVCVDNGPRVATDIMQVPTLHVAETYIPLQLTTAAKFGTAGLSNTTRNNLPVRVDIPIVPESGGGRTLSDFTFECWFKPAADNIGGGILSLSPLSVYQNSDSSGGLLYFLDSTTGLSAAGPALPVGTWAHITWCGSGTSQVLYVNGTQVLTITHSAPVVWTAYVNAHKSSSGGFLDGRNGVVDEVRLTLGKARYTATFTAPTSSFPQFGPEYITQSINSTHLGSHNGSLGTAGMVIPAFSLGPTAQFGTPKVKPVAWGFSTTAFGATRLGSTHAAGAYTPTLHFGRPSSLRADGFQSTTFGLANSPYPQTKTATSTHTTAFGTGRLAQVVFPEGFRNTQLPLAYYPFTQAAVATGELVTNFGKPFGYKVSHLVFGYTCRPAGFAASKFGTPNAAYKQTGVTAGARTSALGTPNGRRVQPTTAVHSTAFGTPSHARVAVASGSISTALGTPTTVRAYRTTGAAPSLKFGTPTGVKLRTYYVTPMRPRARLGKPKVLNRVNRTTAGFTGTHFGTPVEKPRLHATMTPPASRFGKPLLIR